MNPMYITFAIYLVAVLLIGLAAYFSTRNFDDYILGGRSLGPFVTAMSAGASDMSGWLLMGLPGAIYLSGLNEAWIAIGLVIGAYFNWLLVAGRLRVHTEYANNALTLPDYFFHRFGAGGHLMKVVSALIILFFFTIYCASGIVAGATLFQSLFEGITYTQAMWLGAGATKCLPQFKTLPQVQARNTAVCLPVQPSSALFPQQHGAWAISVSRTFWRALWRLKARNRWCRHAASV